MKISDQRAIELQASLKSSTPPSKANARWKEIDRCEAERIIAEAQAKAVPQWPKYVTYKGSKHICDLRRMDGPHVLATAFDAAGQAYDNNISSSPVTSGWGYYSEHPVEWPEISRCDAEHIIAEAKVKASKPCEHTDVCVSLREAAQQTIASLQAFADLLDRKVLYQGFTAVK